MTQAEHGHHPESMRTRPANYEQVLSELKVEKPPLVANLLRLAITQLANGSIEEVPEELREWTREDFGDLLVQSGRSSQLETDDASIPPAAEQTETLDPVERENKELLRKINEFWVNLVDEVHNLIEEYKGLSGEAGEAYKLTGLDDFFGRDDAERKENYVFRRGYYTGEDLKYNLPEEQRETPSKFLNRECLRNTLTAIFHREFQEIIRATAVLDAYMPKSEDSKVLELKEALKSLEEKIVKNGQDFGLVYNHVPLLVSIGKNTPETKLEIMVNRHGIEDKSIRDNPRYSGQWEAVQKNDPLKRPVITDIVTVGSATAEGEGIHRTVVVCRGYAY